jgi:class 3 adenylate cyclase/HAMP domain-containing protein
MTRYRKFPGFYSFRIYFISSLMYFMLVAPIAGFLFMQTIPDLIDKKNLGQFNAGRTNRDTIASSSDTSTRLNINFSYGAGSDENPDADEPSEGTYTDPQNEMLSKSFGFLLQIMLPLSFLLGFIFNYPFKRYLRRKRKGKPISPRLFAFCKKYLLLSPWINSAILGSAYVATLVFMINLMVKYPEYADANTPLFNRFFSISLFAVLLTVLFVYYWQKHRVHIKYLEFFFSHDELKKRIFKASMGKIKNRFWISSAMTTLLPLSIVIVYLIMSFTQIKDLSLSQLNKDQVEILFGRYSTMMEGMINKPDSMEDVGNFFFVNVMDGLIMTMGIGVGIFASLIYILLFVKWTTIDIVYPVRELIYNMQKTGEGKSVNFTVVRSNDEIGELAERFNEMTGQIEQYITKIEKMNKAYYRFVPKQFLDFLEKGDITEVQLGDQVQKEMSVLFTDIRDFTTLSEEMTPKETFDFLNEYLSVMEPLISRNHGFIDKYIGDSIMALFMGNVENAIDAAIEMRVALADFNVKRKMEGHHPINSGIGLHTGNLMLGVVGGLGRMDGTVVSDAVNLASRIEGLTKMYGTSLIISQDTLIKIEDPARYNYRFLDVVKVKGKKEAVYIFEILDGEPAKIKNLKIKTKADFGKGLQLYKNKAFDEALSLFRKVFEVNPHDHAAELYIARCRNIIDFGIPEDWDGVETIKDKY